MGYMDLDWREGAFGVWRAFGANGETLEIWEREAGWDWRAVNIASGWARTFADAKAAAEAALGG